MPAIDLSQTKLFYTDDGEGAPLVFIHGLGASHTMFKPQVQYFSSAYRVICPDMRGNGGSGELTGPVDSILDRQCDDLAELFEKLSIPRAAVCGVSYGGVFGFHFVLRYPQKVAGLVIVDSFGDTHIHSLMEAALMLSQAAGIWAYSLPKSWLVPMVSAQYRHWPLAQKQLVEIVENMRVKEVVLQRKAINQADHTSMLHSVRTPTLGIVGNAADVAIQYMRRAISKIPSARLEVVPDSFDPTNLCQPEIFNRLLHDFLKNLSF